MKIEKNYSDKYFVLKYVASTEHSLSNQEFINLYIDCMKMNDRIIMLNNKNKIEEIGNMFINY